MNSAPRQVPRWPGALLRRAHLRELLAHRLQTLLLGLGIALGVAVVVGVDLANSSARAGFDAGWRTLYGSSTHSITGSSARLDEHSYLALRQAWRSGQPGWQQVLAMRPVLAATVRVQGMDAAPVPVRLLGADLVADLDPGRLGGAGGGDLGRRLLVEPGAVLVGARLATRLGLAAGDPLRLADGAVLQVVGLAGDPADPATDGVLLADLATAQEVLGRRGELSRVDLRLRDHQPVAPAPGWQLADRLFPGLGAMASRPALADPLALPLPDGLQVTAVQALATATRELGGAFHFNLGALSLLALAVAAFLVHQSVQFSVARRRLQWQRQLAMGVRRRELRALVMLEVAVLAVVATLLGILLGGWLAGGLLHLVTTTVSDLYFVVTVRTLQWDLLLLAKAAVLGVGLALLVAWQAAGHMAEDAGARPQPVPRLPRALLALAVGLVLLPLPGVLAALGTVAAFLLGCAWLLAPLLAALAGRLAGLVPARALTLRMLLRRTARSADAAGVAVAAVMVATATGLGMALMIASFRGNVAGWLEQRLAADLYLRLDREHAVTAASADLPALALGQPGVRDAVLYGGDTRLLAGGLVTLEVADPVGPGLARFPLLRGRLPAAGDEVLVSENLARRLGCLDGCTLQVPAAHGAWTLRASGVFADYGGRERMALGADGFRRHLGEPVWFGLAVWLDPQLDADGRAQVRGWLAGLGGEVNDQGAILARSLQVFDRTFAVTRVLRWLAVLVAVAGLVAALLALQLDRRAEFRVLGALGLRRRDRQRLVVAEATVLGTVAGLVAVPVGLGVAWLIVADLNVAAFGWRFALRPPLAPLLDTLLLGLLAGGLAGLVAAWRLPAADGADR